MGIQCAWPCILTRWRNCIRAQVSAHNILDFEASSLLTTKVYGMKKRPLELDTHEFQSKLTAAQWGHCERPMSNYYDDGSREVTNGTISAARTWWCSMPHWWSTCRNVSNWTWLQTCLPYLSTVLWLWQYQLWYFSSIPHSKACNDLAFTMHSRALSRQIVNAINLLLETADRSLLGFRRNTIVAQFFDRHCYRTEASHCLWWHSLTIDHDGYIDGMRCRMQESSAVCCFVFPRAPHIPQS